MALCIAAVSRLKTVEKVSLSSTGRVGPKALRLPFRVVQNLSHSTLFQFLLAGGVEHSGERSMDPRIGKWSMWAGRNSGLV